MSAKENVAKDNGKSGSQENSLKRPAGQSMADIPAKRAMLGLLSILDAYQN